MKYGKQLKRFILTGSIAVEILGEMNPDTFKEELSESDISGITLDTARAAKEPFLCYVAAKVAAANYLWSAVKSVSWDGVVILSGGTCGPLIHAIPDLDSASHSIDWAHYLMNGDWKTIPPVPMFHIVDVRDLAAVYTSALTSPKASNETINIVNSDSLYSHQVLANVIRDILPEMKSKVPEGMPSALIPEGMKFYRILNKKSIEIFGEDISYRSEQETYKDYVLSVLEVMKQHKKAGKNVRGI